MGPDSETLSVPASLRYVPSDPYAVHVTFHAGGDETIEWVFARDLLGAGLHQRTGDGDVAVWPVGRSQADTVCIELSSPSGRAVFEASLDDIVDFVSRSYDAVPPGQEGQQLDLDGTVARLLA
jgi:hypothetical protein